MRSLVLGLLTLFLTVGLAVAGAVAPAAAAGPATVGALDVGDPPGANDWDCRPSAERATPVVLVHGTFGDRKHLLEGLSTDLVADGFCVYSLDYGDRGTGDIRQSAEQLRQFVDRVLTATGAAKVSMVGHSQGGMMPRYYIKYLGGDRVVDDLVGIAPSNHGTSIAPDGFSPLGSVVGTSCRACTQQAAGSEFLTDLNSGDETPGPVSYTQITTKYDVVVVPHTSGYLTPGPESTNITLQDKCRWALVGHVFIPTSRATRSIVLHALTTDGPARPDFRPAC